MYAAALQSTANPIACWSCTHMQHGAHPLRVAIVTCIDGSRFNGWVESVLLLTCCNIASTTYCCCCYCAKRLAANAFNLKTQGTQGQGSGAT